MKKATRLFSSLIGMYSGVLGLLHGVFEIRQGDLPISNIAINAIGPPCQPDLVSHACWPAMTLLPTYQITGFVACLVGFMIIVWSFRARSRYYGTVLAILMLVLLLVGGGILPSIYGFIAALAVFWTGDRLPRAWNRLATLWPWPLVAFFVWIPVELILGQIADDYLKTAGLLIILSIFLLLFLSALTAILYDRRINSIVVRR